MKKVSLLILLVIVASTLLTAAIPTKMVRLTVINKSGDDVYIKLTGSAATEAYYYLTIPSGDRDTPTVKVFTIWVDVYDRETWQCGGLKSSGTMIVDGNLRLTFTPCGEFVKCPWVAVWTCIFRNPCTGECWPPEGYVWLKGHRPAGEPKMEKVTYFRYLVYGAPSWINAYLYTGFWNFGCGTWYYRIRTYRLPYGCQWRYQY
jgi:hypothetical protein